MRQNAHRELDYLIGYAIVTIAMLLCSLLR